MVIHKKLLELALESLAQFFNTLDVGVAMVLALNGNDTIVALSFFLVSEKMRSFGS